MNEEIMPEAKDKTAVSANVIAFPPRIYLTAMIIGILLNILWPVTVGGGYWRAGIGLLLIGLGVFISASGAREFGRRETAVNPYYPASAVVQSGIYRYSRNPMYVGLTAVLLGVGLLINSLWSLLILIPTLLIIYFGVILREEAYMEKMFGQEYLAYKKSVRRWF